MARGRRRPGAVSWGRAALERLEERTLLSGTISGLVFEDYNANGAYDPAATIPNAGGGTIGVAVDRTIAGVSVTAVDGAGVVRGTTTTAADGTYSINATGTGPYRVVFTGLPPGSSEGPMGPNSGSTVQVVPNGNTANVSLGLSYPGDYSVDNPLVATNKFVYGDALAGPYADSPTIVGFRYSVGSQSGSGRDFALPSTFRFAVPARQVGATFGLGSSPTTGMLYASSYTKRFAGYGPDASGTGTTDGAIYAIDPTTGATTMLADLNAIFGANTAGADFRKQAGWSGYESDGGNSGWDAVGKTSLGGLDVSPDGSTVYVVNLANRSLYAIPTGGAIDPSTVRRVSIPFNAPGATGTAGGTQAGDLRPFAVTYYKGRLYVGIVNSAESTQNKADLRAYVYAVNPTTLAFSASPVFQASLNYTRGQAASFAGSGDPSATWNPWSPTFKTLGVGTTASYAQPMLTGLAFDAAGNMVLGLRDRNGDQTGFFTNANPADPTRTYEGISAGDTLMAFISLPFNLSSGWTLENNGRGPAGQGQGPQGTNLGPGGASYFSQQQPGGNQSGVTNGGVYLIPGFNDVIATALDPGPTSRSGGVRFLNTKTGAADKGYQVYNTGFNEPPQSTFGEAGGMGDVVAITVSAPIEIGDRVFRDVDGNGIQDPSEPGIAGVTVHLYRGTTLVGSTITDARGNYLFNGSNVARGLQPNTAYQVRFDKGSDYLAGGPLAGLLPTIARVAPAGSKAVLVGGIPVIDKTTGAAGVNDHSLDAGFIAASRVSGSAFVDANNDGVRQPGEAALAGVTFALSGVDDLGNAVNMMTTTLADGSFTFDGLRPSDATGYTIAESPPAGYLAGTGRPGTLGGTSPRPGGSTRGIVVGQGAAGTDYTFGNLRPSSLSGSAFADVSNDGIRQAGEAGIAGVTMTLTGVDDLGNAVNLTTTTLGDGSYTFANLRPSGAGGYSITESQPPAYFDGRDTVGTPGGTAGNDVITGILLAAGVAGVGHNFGELPPAGLAGRVYFDSNNDGIQQAGEYGIAGVTVTLTGVNDLGNAVNLTVTTAADGSYTFNNLRPSGGAGYTISETQPAGYLDGRDRVGTQGGTAGNDAMTRIALIAGVSGAGNDFGELPPANLSGSVYLDANDDGIRQAGEAGIAGVTVTLTGTNDLGAVVNLVAITTADGSYTFNNLRPSGAGGYTITESQPAGYLDGRDTAGTQGGTAGNDAITGIALAAGVAGSGNDFGELQAASLSGSVYVDSNDDGIRQAGEAGIAGVKVALTGTNDLGAPVNLAATTAADGSYFFSGLRPGLYTLTDIPPAAYTVGQASVGTAGGTRNGPSSVAQVALTSGSSATSYDFGQTGATVSGRVFVDLDNNGIQSAGEVGLGGTTLALLDSANQVRATTTSAADGSYAFVDLPAGNYTVVETPPSGYGASTPASVPVAVTTAGAAGVNFGAGTAALAGIKFYDANGNGTYEPGTDFVGPGGTVTLTGVDVNGRPVSLTTSTNADGSFAFIGLIASNAAGYSVAASVAPGLSAGTATPGTAGGVAVANADTVTGIVLAAGEGAAGYRFPEGGTTIYQGVVYVDANRNGTRDPGEVGVAGVTIRVTPPQGGSFTTTTDASGSYTFAGFSGGTAFISEIVPAGYGTTTPTTLLVNIPEPGNVTGRNFGLSASSLAGRVYVDANDDGIPQSGEQGIAGTTVNLRNAGNTLIATTTTASDGTYAFANLPAGVYSIEEAQPPAYGQGQAAAGSVGGSTAVTNLISGIELPASTAAAGYNFGERGGSITGTVFLDANANAAIDAGEAGRGGVAVQLLAADGTLVAVATSDPTGAFRFDDLPAGNYATHLARPIGFGISASTDAPATLTPAGSAAVAYGLTTSSLSGRAYLDLNGSGTRDPGEAAIAGVTITLTGTDAAGLAVSRTAVTAADGTYTFAGLAAGAYSVAQSRPAGYRVGRSTAGPAGGTGAPDLVAGIGLPAGTAAAGYDFGSLGYAVAGMAYIDANRDGVRGPGEVGLGGVTLALFGAANQILATTTTAGDGTYSFANVPAGAYSVVETAPAGYGTSTTTTVPVTVTDAGAAPRDFGLTTASIAGAAFLDANQDGQFSPGVDLPGVGLQVFLGGVDLNGTPVFRTAVAEADGRFAFDGLLQGTYIVLTAPLPGASPQPAVPGSAGGTVGGLGRVDGIALGAGVRATGYLYPAAGATVSGTVYDDANRDGAFDAGDRPVAGAIVTLTGVNPTTGQPITLTALSDAAGRYVFSGVVSAAATLQVQVPAGYGPGMPNVINAAIPLAGLAGQDLGLTTARIAGSVFFDRANDGSREAIDAPLAGVTLQLTGVDANGAAVSLTTLTAADGSYSFDGLNAGTYTIEAVPPAGYLDGRGGGGFRPSAQVGGIVLAAGEASDGINFAELAAAGLAGSVYVDANNDGTRDPGEVGVPGVPITLTGVDDRGELVRLTTTTDATGDYSFAGLRPGDYSIAVARPAGYFAGTDEVGSQGGTLGNGAIVSIELDPGVVGVGNDFAVLAPAIAAGVVFVDANDNRAADPGEAGIAGVIITLTGVDDLGNAVRLTTTTAADGSYAFANLRPSDAAGYTVTEARPAGYLPGLDAATSALSDGIIRGVVLAAGQAQGAIDFAELRPARIGGVVFRDDNRDGVQQAGEPGVAGVVLTLTGVDDLGNAVNLTTTTDADGSYEFINLRPSLDDNRAGLITSYTIAESQPPGYLDGIDTAGTSGGVATDDVIAAIHLPEGANSLGNTFAEVAPTVRVGGYVYEDANGDGIRQPGEAGIAGVIVTLTGRDDLGAAVRVAVTTQADGSYIFANLRPSDAAGYMIVESQPPGYLDGLDAIGTPGGTSGNDAFSAIVLRVDGSVGSNYNFGEIRPAVLSGFVYADSDANGMRSAGDPGIGGVAITLTGVDDRGQVVDRSTTTAADGSYSFADLRPSGAGGYTLTQSPPAGYRPGRPNVGTTGGVAGPDTLAGLVLAPGSVGMGNDFGDLPYASIAGSVYLDANQDGARGPGEGGIGGISVTLTGTDLDGNPVQTSAVTQADGSYRFSGLLPGSYAIADTPPAGYLPGRTSAGSSGGSAAGNAVSAIAIAPGVAAAGYDFAAIGVTVVGTTFLDGNGDGIWNPGEPAAGGVAVTLLGADGTPLGSIVSGPDGSYRFANLPLAGYGIAATPPDGFAPSASAPLAVGGFDPVSGVARRDIGLRAVVPTGSLAGYLYVDADSSGTRSAGDPPLAGVLVTLSGTDLAGNAIVRQASTAADGSYVFANLPAGTYSVRAADVAGYTDAASAAGGLGGVSGSGLISFIPLGRDSSGAGYDFGKVLARAETPTSPTEPTSPSGPAQPSAPTRPSAPITSSISGTVYLDARKDGRFDPVDFGVAHVSVVLTGTDALGRSVILTTMTDGSGHYAFDNLTAGTYRLEVVAPAAFFRTGRATPGIAGGIGRGNVIMQIGFGEGTAAVGNNFGELIRPGCRLNEPALRSLLRFGPDATSVPAALARRIGRLTPGGPVGTYLPTLAALASANGSGGRVSGSIRTHQAVIAPRVGKAHPTGLRAHAKPKGRAARFPNVRAHNA